MKKAGPIAAVVLALSAGGIFFLSGEDKIVNVEGARLAEIDNAVSDADASARCEGGAIRLGNRIMCITEKPSVQDELDVTPAASLSDLWICDVQDETGKWSTEAQCVRAGTSLAKDCALVCEDLKWCGYSLNTIESGTEACLRTACAPCPVAAGDWGACPHCLSNRTPSCAEACPALSEEIP